MATIVCPFHHAIQSQNDTADVTKYSGNILAGWSRGTNYDNNLGVTHYWCKLYYELPSDFYKYWARGYFYPSVNATIDARQYNKFEWEGHPATYSNQDSTYDVENFFANAFHNSGDFATATSPGINTTYPFYFQEADFNIIQQLDSDYIEITVFLDYGKPIGSEVYSGTYRSTSYLATLKNIELTSYSFNINPVEIIVSPIYPLDVYARNDRDLIVDWDLLNNVNRSSTYLYQDSNTVTITDKNGNSIETGISGSTDSQVTFDTTDLGDLTIGECTVHVVVTTNYGTTGEATFSFELVGQSDAPEITSVTQNSYPTVTWTSTNQISWEMIISNALGVVYKSGMVIGDEQSFTVPILLEDGGYSIELRYVNSYGLLTAWESYFVDLQPTKPDAPEGIIVSARTDFGVSISCSDMETTGKLLVVRRKDENSTPVVLGEYNGLFVDYLIGLNDYHQYTIRNYVDGYADGEWIDGVVLAGGEVVRDADDYSKFIHVWKSDDAVPNYAISEDKSDVLVQCIGRKFPVAELGEWVTSTRSFNGHVSEDDFKKLRNMKLNSSHVLLQGNEEYMPCYMEFSDAGHYINGGRMISFNMTRIDGDK